MTNNPPTYLFIAKKKRKRYPKLPKLSDASIPLVIKSVINQPTNQYENQNNNN